MSKIRLINGKMSASNFADTVMEMNNPEDGIYISLQQPENAKVMASAVLSAEQIFKRMLSYWNDPYLYERMRADSREWLKNFSKEDIK